MSKEKDGCFLDKQTYVDDACKVIESLKTKKIRVGKGNEIEYIPVLTTTQIRKLLSQLNEIYSFVVTMSNGNSTKTGVNADENRVTDLVEKMQYFKMRCIYEAGRDNDNVVKDFIIKAKIIEYIESMCADKQYKSIREKFILFFRYMEALVAYHRFKGGKDK